MSLESASTPQGFFLPYLHWKVPSVACVAGDAGRAPAQASARRRGPSAGSPQEGGRS